MKSEKLYESITDIRDDLIEKAHDHHFNKAAELASSKEVSSHPTSHHRFWISSIAAALVLVLTVLSLLSSTNFSSALAPYEVAAAQYPDRILLPNQDEFIGSFGGVDDWSAYDAYHEALEEWADEQLERRMQAKAYGAGPQTFFAQTIPEILQSESDENKVYSPLNLYIALGMLAEVTDGNSRRQILQLTGADDIDALQDQVSVLWETNYCNDGSVTSILANSLWLNENYSFSSSTLKRLAENYYASSFQGPMGSDELNQALQNWLNEQTGNLLQEQVANQKMDADTIMAMAATIYFRAQWSEPFIENATEKESFNLAEGQSVTCDFMHQSFTGDYYQGNHFSAVAQSLKNSGSMWLILPDEGVSLDQLLMDEQTVSFMLSNGDWETSSTLLINLSLPKFDVSSNLDLIPELRSLGITDVFDSELSDFSPMTQDTDEIFLSKVDHTARVTIDEEGCVATAYTVMEITEAAMIPPDEEVDFVLNRPFLFVITSDTGIPLFVGRVNQPSE